MEGHVETMEMFKYVGRDSSNGLLGHSSKDGVAQLAKNGRSGPSQTIFDIRKKTSQFKKKCRK